MVKRLSVEKRLRAVITDIKRFRTPSASMRKRLIVLLVIPLLCYIAYRHMRHDWRAFGGVPKKITLETHASRPIKILARHLKHLTLPKLPDGTLVPSSHDAFAAYIHCIRQHMTMNIWRSFHPALQHCRSTVMEMRSILSNLVPYVNMYEIKWTLDMDKQIFKMLNPGECTVVTLGVGFDAHVEFQMRDRFNGTCEFFGVDPVREINEELYSHVGKFYPTAVGATTGSFEAKVLDAGVNRTLYRQLLDSMFGKRYHWVKRQVIHIDLRAFINNIVQRPVIDLLLLDIEGGENALLPMFIKGDASFENHNITVCMLSMEYHQQRREYFDSWMTALLEEGKWIFLQTDRLFNHYQLLAVNVADPLCYARYVKRFFS